MKRRGERGHLMVGLMAAITILVIMSTIAEQAWVDVVQRDNEAEMMFRAQDLVRALKRYQKDRGALPTELEQLMEPGTRGQYFLRKLHTDPLVPDGKWGILFMNPNGGVFDPSMPQPDQASLLGSSSIMPQSEPGKSLFPSSKLEGGTAVKGLPIAGVKSLCKDRPFRVYRDSTDYAQWLFTVFDLTVPGGGTGSQKPGMPGGQAPNRGATPRMDRR